MSTAVRQLRLANDAPPCPLCARGGPPPLGEGPGRDHGQAWNPISIHEQLRTAGRALPFTSLSPSTLRSQEAEGWAPGGIAIQL